MQLTITSFGGIPSATIQFQTGPNLVAGPNGAGKSTICRAVAACSGDAVIPICNPDGTPSLLKKSAILLVQGGKGAVTLARPEGGRRISYPVNGMKTTGEGPLPRVATRFALGLASWMAIPQADRLTTLMSSLANDPSNAVTRADLDAAVTNHNLSQAALDYVWSLLENPLYGFEVAHAEASKRVSEAAGAWKATTRENYGTDKVKNYFPQGWSPDLVSAKVGDLQQAVILAKTAVENAIANQAVDAADVARMEKIVAQEKPNVPGLEATLNVARLTLNHDVGVLQEKMKVLQKEPENITKARGDLAAAFTKLTEIKGQIATLKAGVPRVDAICPGCGLEVAVQDVGLAFGKHMVNDMPVRFLLDRISGGVDQGKIDALLMEGVDLQTSKDAADKLIADRSRLVAENRKTIQAEIDKVSESRGGLVRKAEAALLEGKRLSAEIDLAQGKLNAISVRGAGASAEDVAALRLAYSTAVSRKTAKEVKTNADIYAEDARQYAVIKDITAPAGLRKTKMEQALAGINDRLLAICNIAGWGSVSITADTDLLYLGRPYIICSGAERYRCQVTMQVMMALLDQSPVLIFDGADILDSPGRKGLLNILRTLPIPTIVAMTSKLDYAQGLAKLFKTTHWVEQGVVTNITPGAVSVPAPAPAPSVDQSPTPALTPEDPALAEFKRKLKSHDWLYEMSDDPSQRRKGEGQRRLLISIATKEGVAFQDAFDEAAKKSVEGTSILINPTFPQSFERIQGDKS